MLIVDVSFAHDAVTGELLAAHGIDGVIGYASLDTDKNMSAANLADWLEHGRLVGLVHEDRENDMTGGAAAGASHGVSTRIWARTVGYDLANCVAFAADDRDTGPTDLPAVLAYMQMFAQYVAHPGYYGDQDSIDYLARVHPEWWFWQSESPSFGTGISTHAHLVQRYADPRVAGLPVDANDVLIAGIPWMGEDMYTEEDRARDVRMAGQLDKIAYSEQLELPAVAEIRGNAQNIAHAVTSLHLAPDPAALAAALAPLLHTVQSTELVDALSQALNKVTVTLSSS